MVNVSVIVPACNEENYISRTLESLKNQGFKDFEVIVVCNGCSDSTAKIAGKFTNKVYNLKERGISLAKNFGAEKSRGRILCFLDADSLIDKNMLERVDRLVKKGYVGGSCVTIPDNNKIRAKLVSFIFNLDSDNWGGFCFCTREIFDKVKFNENMKMYEDIDFGREVKKLGKVIFMRKYRVKTSMRRFEKNGYLKGFLYTIFNGFGSRRYKVVR